MRVSYSHSGLPKRSVSRNITDQETHQTCHAHVISKMLVRFIFLLTDDIPQTNKGCDILYRTETCEDIFNCLDIPELNCSAKNIVLALLFNAFYKIIRDKNTCGGNITDARLPFDYCKDITKEKFDSLWLVDSPIPSKFADLFDQAFIKFNTLNHVGDTIAVIFRRQTLHDKSSIKVLTKVLDLGLYLFIADDDNNKSHSMTITGYDVIPGLGEYPDEPYFKVKNSWGSNNSYEKICMEDGFLSMDVITSIENPCNKFISYISFIIIKNDFDKIIENFKEPYSFYPLNYGEPKIKYIKPKKQSKIFRSLRKFGSSITGLHNIISKSRGLRKNKNIKTKRKKR